MFGFNLKTCGVVTCVLLVSLVGCFFAKLDTDEEKRIIEKAIHIAEDISSLDGVYVNTDIYLVKNFSKLDYEEYNETWLVTDDDSLLANIDYTVIIGNQSTDNETNECYIKLYYISAEKKFIVYSLISSYSQMNPLVPILD